MAADWPRFHGADGSGVSLDKGPTPTKWSETENLKWKAKLPGPGSSSPIVIGQRVVVTCWSGYGADPANEGEESDLRRHVVCLDRDTGKVLWDQVVEPVLPEDPYSGQFTQHGYASHTPVSDGKQIYVFFGKTGVLAFDLEGKKLWQTSVGTGSGFARLGHGFQPRPVQEPGDRSRLGREQVVGGPGSRDRQGSLAVRRSRFHQRMGYAAVGRLRSRPHRPGDCRTSQDLGFRSRYGQTAVAQRRT